MLKVENLDGFKPVGRHKKKKQIVITHTSRVITDYVSSLKNRYNGNYKKLPHYIINRDGVIFNIIPPNTYGEYLETPKHNKNSIIISLENLGWLRKNPLSRGFINWIGNMHNDEIFEKKWRGYFFWQPYTEKQIDSLTMLVSDLCEKFQINKESLGHNVLEESCEDFNGIITRSNFYKDKTDVNPSFNFDIFINKIRHE